MAVVEVEVAAGVAAGVGHCREEELGGQADGEREGRGK